MKEDDKTRVVNTHKILHYFRLPRSTDRLAEDRFRLSAVLYHALAKRNHTNQPILFHISLNRLHSGRKVVNLLDSLVTTSVAPGCRIGLKLVGKPLAIDCGGR